MVRFLHISDIHLGTNQYNSPDETRKKDFFFSFLDVIKKHAIDEQVDFVIITGDLFDKSKIDPKTLNHAIVVLSKLKQNNIPTFVIEGNHDTQIGQDSISWLQFLGEHGYIHFMRPDFEDGKTVFNSLEKNSSEGKNYCGYFDFNDNVRIVGTQWFGSNTTNVIPEITEALNDLGDYPYTIMMLHAGLEGFLAGYGTLTKSAVAPLKDCVNYLALGHIHKYYSLDDWIFSPGSLEVCSFPEYFDPHGAILVEIDEDNNTKFKLIEDYKKRTFLRLKVDISDCSSSDKAFQKITDCISKYSGKKLDKPMVELTIDGTIGFKRSDLNIEKIKEIALNELKALMVLVKYFARPKEYSIGADLTVKNTREKIEFTVIKDMLAQLDCYKDEQDKYSKLAINLKDMILNTESNEKILCHLKETILD